MTGKYYGGGRDRVGGDTETRIMSLRIGADVYAMLMAHTTADERRDVLYRLARWRYEQARDRVSEGELDDSDLG